MPATALPAEVPPPALQAFALEWQSYDALDSQKLDLIYNPSATSYYPDFGYYPILGTVESPRQDDLVRRHRIENYHSTPPDHHPMYNQSEYLAQYADWKRGRERAAMRESLPARPKAKPSARGGR